MPECVGGQRYQVANCPPQENSAVYPTPISLVQAPSRTPISPGSPSSVDVPFWPLDLFSLPLTLTQWTLPGFSVLDLTLTPLMVSFHFKANIKTH